MFCCHRQLTYNIIFAIYSADISQIVHLVAEKAAETETSKTAKSKINLKDVKIVLPFFQIREIHGFPPFIVSQSQHLEDGWTSTPRISQPAGSLPIFKELCIRLKEIDLILTLNIYLTIGLIP